MSARIYFLGSRGTAHPRVGPGLSLLALAEYSSATLRLFEPLRPTVASEPVSGARGDVRAASLPPVAAWSGRLARRWQRGTAAHGFDHRHRDVRPIDLDALNVPGAAEQVEELTLVTGDAKLLRLAADVRRARTDAEGICQAVQFAPRVVSLQAQSKGTAYVTLWFAGSGRMPRTYRVRVRDGGRAKPATADRSDHEPTSVAGVADELVPDQPSELPSPAQHDETELLAEETLLPSPPAAIEAEPVRATSAVEPLLPPAVAAIAEPAPTVEASVNRIDALAARLRDLFPDSRLTLHEVEGKVFASGTALDRPEAAEILTIVRRMVAGQEVVNMLWVPDDPRLTVTARRAVLDRQEALRQLSATSADSTTRGLLQRLASLTGPNAAALLDGWPSDVFELEFDLLRRQGVLDQARTTRCAAEPGEALRLDGDPLITLVPDTLDGQRVQLRVIAAPVGGAPAAGPRGWAGMFELRRGETLVVAGPGATPDFREGIKPPASESLLFLMVEPTVAGTPSRLPPLPGSAAAATCVAPAVPGVRSCLKRCYFEAGNPLLSGPFGHHEF